MEVQLEEEYEDKQKVLRERRELEAKLLSAQDQVYNSTCKCFYFLSSFFISLHHSTSCIMQMQYIIYSFGPIPALLFCLSQTLYMCQVRQNYWLCLLLVFVVFCIPG